MRVMAMQVEVSSALPPLTNRSELANEAQLQQAFASTLSDASNKPGELPGPLSPWILEERNKFGNPLRPATMPPVASRPRLTAKPFCLGKSSDTFTVVKPPVPALKPSSIALNPPAFANTFEDMTVAKGLTGNVPPLVDQKLIENKTTGELVANMPFDSSPQANTVILFETGRSVKSRVKFTPEKDRLSSPEIRSSFQAPEGQLHPAGSEAFCRAASIHRQLSLSSEARPVSWKSCVSLEREDSFTGASEEKGETIERQHSSGISLAYEGHPRPKQRPVSAIFLESLKDQKHYCSEVSDEKSLPERSGVRKPRPLSMDLTAKFENKDFSLLRKSCPTESKEKNLSTDPTNQGSVRPSERWTKSEAMALGKADSSKLNLKSPGPYGDFTCILNQKPFLNEGPTPCQGMQQDLAQVSARDRKCLWELRLKRQNEQNASETETGTTPKKGTEPPGVKGQAVKDSAVLSQNELCAAKKDCANISDTEKQDLRDVENPVNMLDKSANESNSVTVASQQEGPGNENRIMNIQQRIKELTAENTDSKPGILRRSFRPRPLSADLTKLFSSPVIPSELKSEKLTEMNRKPANETQETEEMKINLLHGTVSGEGHTGGVQWRSQQPIKTLPLQRNGSFAREKHNVALHREIPASVADHDMHTSSAALAEKASIKTVRATMFEHNVQRHKVAADHLGGEPPSQLMNELAGTGRESKVEQVAEAKTFSKEVPCRQLDTWVAAEKPGKANSLNGDGVLQETVWKRCENPTAKCVEDSLVYQRIEPRYEILQTVGKRAQSEAIPLVCEDKAVTLRSRRSLKERKKSGEGFVDASWSCSLDLKGDCRKEDGFIFKMKEAGETSAKTGTFNVSCGQSAFCEQVIGFDINQIGQKHVKEASNFINRKTATDERISMMSLELEKEKNKDKMEGSKMLKLLPENFRARPDRIEGGEVGADGRQSTFPGASEELMGSSKLPCHGADMTSTHEREESRECGGRKYSTVHCAQRTSDAAGHRTGGDPAQHLGAEEQEKRSSRVSGGKTSDRWRRKTLPHGIRFEEAGALAEESVKMLIRRDSLQFHEGSVAKKSKKPRCVVEPKEGTLVSPGTPEDVFKDQQSSSKPKVTYFAVTGQIPNEAEGSSVKELAHKSKQISSLVENTSFAFSAQTARKSYSLSEHQFCPAVSDTPGSSILDKCFGKNWEEAGEEDPSDLLKKGVFKYPASEGRDENWRSLKRQVDDAKERIPGVEPSLHSVIAYSPCELKSPSYLRHLHQDDEHLGHKKHSNSSCGAPKEKTTDNYRSRVLDIDALMAEYKEDSLKPPVIQDWREGEGSSLFPWEKYKRSSSDKISLNFNRKDPQTLKGSFGSPRQDIYSMEVCGSENVCVDERERLKSCSEEPSSFQYRDGKFSPPPWGRPSVVYVPSDAAGTKKKTFILDEPEECQELLRPQSVKHGESRMQVHGPVCLDLKAESSFAPHPSSVLADSTLWKGTCSNQQQATNVPLEHDWLSASSLSKRKSSVAGSPRKSHSSIIQNQAEWNTSAFTNASPDLTGSYSEKNHQARVKGSLPVGPEAKERQDQHKVRPSKDNGQNRQSTSQQRSVGCEDKKDTEKEWSRQDPESPGSRSSSHLSLQRRSRSFYKDRRVDHWATMFLWEYVGITSWLKADSQEHEERDRERPCQDQLKQCFGRPAAEAKDTDTLVREADSHYGTWSEQQPSEDSLVAESPASESNVASARKKPPGSRLSSFFSQTDPASTTDPHDSSRDPRSASLDHSSTDVDSADGAEGPAVAEACPDFSFLEQTSVLDSSVLKTRVQLSKRRRQHRAPISHVLRRSGGREAEWQPFVAEEAGCTWMFKDSTEKSAKPEDSEEQGRLHPPSGRLPLSQPQRLPMFPGLDHSALKAQLRRRQEPEGIEELGPGPLSRSPKPTFQTGASGVRVLPAGTEKEERLEEVSQSPPWLKELKSKKRQSQHENQV